MNNWKDKLFIGDIFNKFNENDIELNEVCKEISSRLKKCKFAADPELVDIIDDFENVVQTVEDFDKAMDALYDFGDCGFRLWVDTFNVAEAAALN